MPFRTHVHQFTFSAGQLDTEMQARSDADNYFKGGKDLTNMIGRKAGGLDVRAGFAYVAEIAAAEDGVRIAEFRRSTEAVYLVVFTDGEIRIYRDDALLATVAASDFTAARLPSIAWVQSLDTMVIVHEDVYPKRLVRQGNDSSWAIENLPLTNLPTFNFGEASEGNATPSATTGTSITVTSTEDDFASAASGMTVIINDGKVLVTSKVSNTQIQGDVLQDLSSTAAAEAGLWSLDEDAWSAIRGYPRCAYLFEGRLYFGGSKSRPQTVWGSRAGNFFSFRTTSDAFDDEAVEMTMDNDSVAAIEQLYALDDFFAFTSGGIFVNQETPVTPSNFFFKRNTQLPAANIRPVEIDGVIAFVQRSLETGDHQSVHGLFFNDSLQIYEAEDLAFLAAEILDAPVDMTARRGDQKSSVNHLFLVNEDGTIATMNIRRSQDIAGWMPWATSGEFLAATVVNSTLYACVKRTIDGTDRWFLEKQDTTHRLDCSVAASGSSSDTWSGFSHLNGHEVRLIGDGADMGVATVSAGEIALAYDVSTLEAGLSFDWAAETMPLEARNRAIPTLIGEKSRLIRATIHLLNAYGCSINGRALALNPLPVDMDAAPAPISGTRSMRFLGWSGGTSGQPPTVRVTGQAERPASILSVTAEVGQ